MMGAKDEKEYHCLEMFQFKSIKKTKIKAGSATKIVTGREDEDTFPSGYNHF